MSEMLGRENDVKEEDNAFEAGWRACLECLGFFNPLNEDDKDRIMYYERVYNDFKNRSGEQKLESYPDYLYK